MERSFLSLRLQLLRYPGAAGQTPRYQGPRYLGDLETGQPCAKQRSDTLYLHATGQAPHITIGYHLYRLCEEDVFLPFFEAQPRINMHAGRPTYAAA